MRNINHAQELKIFVEATKNMQKITYKGQQGYFITEDQKKQLDKVVIPLLSNCGEDYNENQEL